jgi:3-deoxy-D-manno-octulosonic-acid transferase
VAYLLNAAYLLALALLAPWLLWRAMRTGRYREGLAAKLLGAVPRREDARRCLWFHAVSVGEVNLLAPLLRTMGTRHPGWQCVLSTTTQTGMALARKKYPETTVFYCPLDFTWAVGRAMRRIRPDALVLVELELWPNLIRAARRHGARVAVVNGRLGERSFRGYRRLRPLLRPTFERIDLAAAQDETCAERFRALGVRAEAVRVTGSMKYDGAQTDRDNPATRRLAALAGFQPGDVVFLAGSTQAPEEAVALEVFRRLSAQWPALRLVIVPRHPERFEEVAQLLDVSGVAWQRRSVLGEPAGATAGLPGSADPRRVDAAAIEPHGTKAATRNRAGPCRPGLSGAIRPGSEAEHDLASLRLNKRVLLVDTVGELGAWWGTARVAFVGGSLGSRGGQNMIEPAGYGAAVSFGPNTRNFRDIVAGMLAAEAAVVVRDADELTAFVRRCMEDPEYAAALGRRARQLVLRQLGATDRTFEMLAGLLESG